MIIRPMTPADVGDCARIMVETPLWQRHGVTAQAARDRLLGGIASGAGLFVIVDQEGEPAAGFVWCVERGAFDRSGYIRILAVEGQRRGQGIGGVLLRHAEAYLSQTAPDVFLLVSDFNRDAQRFYERNGYAQIGAIPGYLSPGVAELLYHKRLRD